MNLIKLHIRGVGILLNTDMITFLEPCIPEGTSINMIGGEQVTVDENFTDIFTVQFPQEGPRRPPLGVVPDQN